MVTGGNHYNSDEPLISIHVPKNAGTSVRWTLEQWFGTENVLPHYWDEAAHPPLLSGNYGPVFVYTDISTRAVGLACGTIILGQTNLSPFLRDPFEVHLSLYFYLKMSNASYHFDGELFKINKRYKNFDSFLEMNLSDLKLPFAQTFW